MKLWQSIGLSQRVCQRQGRLGGRLSGLRERNATFWSAIPNMTTLVPFVCHFGHLGAQFLGCDLLQVAS